MSRGRHCWRRSVAVSATLLACAGAVVVVTQPALGQELPTCEAKIDGEQLNDRGTAHITLELDRVQPVLVEVHLPERTQSGVKALVPERMKSGLRPTSPRSRAGWTSSPRHPAGGSPSSPERQVSSTARLKCRTSLTPVWGATGRKSWRGGP